MMKYFISGIFLLCSVVSFAQETQDTTKEASNIFVKNSDSFLRIAEELPAIQYLKGNVKMYQDSIFMFCDSAILIENNLTAIGNVIIIQADTIVVHSDSLVYNGNLKIADLYGNVSLENGENQLFTNTLHYDLNTKLATYQDTAILQNARTQVSSIEGIFDVNRKEAKFIKEVLVLDSTFTMTADSLLYNTSTDVATFLGPTDILKEEKKIYCESGYYDLRREYAEFVRNARYADSTSIATADRIIYDSKTDLITLDGNAYYKSEEEEARATKITMNQSTEDTELIGNASYKGKDNNVSGEKILFNKKTESLQVQGRSALEEDNMRISAEDLSYIKETGKGLAKGNVVWKDTVQNNVILSELINYNNTSEYAEAIRVDDVRPVLKQLLDKDTLYVCADTLLSYADNVVVGDSIPVNDTIRYFRASKDVRIYNEDISAIADSVRYNDQDSTFVLMGNPVMWSDTSQFSGDTIFLHLVESKVKDIRIINQGMIITSLADKYYNQISGKNIHAFMDSSYIEKMNVAGNARSLYFIQDEEEDLVGANRTDCSKMTFFFEQDSLTDILFFTKPESLLTPIADTKESDLYLEGFSWMIDQKPFSVEDIRDVSRGRKQLAAISLQAKNDTLTTDTLAMDSLELDNRLNSKIEDKTLLKAKEDLLNSSGEEPASDLPKEKVKKKSKSIKTKEQ